MKLEPASDQIMKKRTTFNPKRRLCPPPASEPERLALKDMANRARYGGNPEHKRIGGDFGLSPPSQPRQGKTLCDDAGVFERSVALGLLREGLNRGLISVQMRNGWPQNIWAVTPNGIALEAQREADGAYHGYPMPLADPFREVVLARWASP